MGLNGANRPADYLYSSNQSITKRAQKLSVDEENCYRIAAGEDPAAVEASPASAASAGNGASGAHVARTADQIQTSARACRDHVVGENLAFINDMWSMFQRNYFAHSGTTTTFYESSTIGLGAFAAVSPAGTAHILAATAATLSGLGTSIQKNLQGGQLSYVLLAQMDADREQIGAQIRLNLLLDYGKYPLSVAMYDVASYAGSLSVPSALANISAATGAKRSQTVAAVYGASAASAASAASGTRKRTFIESSRSSVSGRQPPPPKRTTKNRLPP
ncbi:hypothetical protein LFL97_35555 [Burkholderia sp. JSH-S8]|nr:hypothetical protein LFL97_35555 [Burkholderia sp. JSH-S8]